MTATINVNFTNFTASLTVSDEALAKVSFSDSDRETVKQVRLLTAAIISIVATPAQPGTPPAGNVEAFVNAQIAAMQQAVSILNAV